MATVTNGAGANYTTAPTLMYGLISFLRANSGWQIIGSGDGVSGGMGTPASPIDVVDAAADWSNNNFWLVWQLGTTLQMMLQRVGTGVDCDFYVNEALDYTGGSATVRPTSPSGASIKLNGTALAPTISSGTRRAHFLCQTGTTRTTAGWFMFVRNPADGLVHSSLGFIPIANLQSGDTHDYALALQNGPTSADVVDHYQWSGSLVRGLLYAIDPAAPTVATSFILAGPGHYAPTDNATSGTENLGQVSNGDDWLYPGVLLRTRGQYKGTTSFMQRPGSDRAVLSTFNSLSNICFGSYVLPWDGVSTPTAS